MRKLLYALSIVLVAGGGLVVAQHVQTNKPALTAPRTLGDTYPLLSTAYAGVKVFRLNPVPWVVNSAYWYESGLLDYKEPIADVDYGTGYSAHQRIQLPGFWRDRYTSRGAIYISGSGWASLWVTPSGFAFALLHLSRVLVSARAYAPPGASAGPLPPQGNGGDERTIAIVNQVMRSAPPASGYARGGTVIGYSGWPSSSQYSNGSCYDYNSCAVDAHLCLVTTAGAATWFYRIATGQHHALHRRHK